MQDGSNNGLLAMLKVIDTIIEIETKSSNTYHEMAQRTNYEGNRALLAWLYNVESSRLARLVTRRRVILKDHPELIDNGIYAPRPDTGLTKMGTGREKLAGASALVILRYAVESEARAKQYFQRKAAAATDAATRMMLLAAASEHDDQIEYYGGQREALLQQQIQLGARRYAEAVA